MKHDAFTLIELLVVITIIMVLVGFLIIDFNAARRFQELDLMAQQSLALMEQSRASVDSGRIDEEDPEQYVCLGGYFAVDEIPLLVKMDFDPVLETCDVDTREESIYGIIQGPVTVNSILLENSYSEIWAMFVPPEADLVFYSESGNSYAEDGSISIVHENNEELTHTLNFSTLTNQVTLAVDEE